MLVRTDIPLADQVVQVGHACLEAAWRSGPPPEPCNLVVLALPSQAALQDALERLAAAGIAMVSFSEPDDDLGLTAACSAPISGRERAIFRRYRLWGAAVHAPARAPPLTSGTEALSKLIAR